jgi:3'-phosphoadenosine 5'-phosphosulfate sulfotransferase (PAPS reductase)/FAD synthetase
MLAENILSISGGKDSTAMMLEMLERGEVIHSAVFFDTGWEFPAMYDHIDKLEKYTGVKIWRLHSRLPFDYWLIARPVIARKGPDKGKVHRIGNGWPNMNRRWCTKQKTDTLDLFISNIPNAVSCIGYAADEHRALISDKIHRRFPLQEYGITEQQALKICYLHGFDWDGLYNHFNRVSCFCCPLQRMGELRTLYHEFPELWQRMIDMENAMGEGAQRGFRQYTTVKQLGQRFAEEDKQGGLFKITEEVRNAA